MKNLTKIVVVLDRSASMYDTKKQTVEGFNKLIEEQAQIEGEVNISLYQFATEIQITYLNKELTDKNRYELKLNDNEGNYLYKPTGRSTSLRDAIGTVINSVGLELCNLNESERPNNVVVVIITDGMDNSSKEFSLNTIKDIITHQQSVYNWTFLYLGANINNVKEASNMGISINTIASYKGNKNIMFGYAGVSSYLNKQRTAKSRNVNLNLQDEVGNV